MTLGVRPGDTLLFETGKFGIRVRPVKTGSPFAKYRCIGMKGFFQASTRMTGLPAALRGEEFIVSTPAIFDSLCRLLKEQ